MLERLVSASGRNGWSQQNVLLKWPQLDRVIGEEIPEIPSCLKAYVVGSKPT
jgi:hypothetical protein